MTAYFFGWIVLMLSETLPSQVAMKKASKRVGVFTLAMLPIVVAIRNEVVPGYGDDTCSKTTTAWLVRPAHVTP